MPWTSAGEGPWPVTILITEGGVIICSSSSTCQLRDYYQDLSISHALTRVGSMAALCTVSFTLHEELYLASTEPMLSSVTCDVKKVD